MVNTSARPITVDGVRLDTLAWNVEKVDRATAQRRSGDYDIPNMDGALPSLNDPLEPSTFGLSMWLRGTDADGAVPAAGSLTTLRANLDELLHLFGQRHKLLELRETVDAVGTERRAWAKVTDSIAPELNTPGSAGSFAVAFSLPYGCWEDVATQDFASATNPTPGTALEVSTLAGATDRITDAIFVVDGPAVAPRLTDPATGMWVELGRTLAAGESWRFNSATWSSRYGAGVTTGSADATGTDATAVTNTGGPSRAYGLPLTPVRLTGARRVQLALSGSGFTTSTRFLVRARRKYAA